jgi:hypothetical protein
MCFMLWEVQRVILGTAKAASPPEDVGGRPVPYTPDGFEHTATQRQHYRRSWAVALRKRRTSYCGAKISRLLHHGSDGSAFTARRYPGCRISEATQSAGIFLRIRNSLAVCGVC